MNFVTLLAANKLEEAKQSLFQRLDAIASFHLSEMKKIVGEERFELVEANSNIVRMGRITRIRRRVRRNSKGRIVIQKNARRSMIKGYRIVGNSIRRIPAGERLRKQRLLKRSWKTTRRAKLRRTLLKRKLSMRRRSSLGLR